MDRGRERDSLLSQCEEFVWLIQVLWGSAADLVSAQSAVPSSMICIRGELSSQRVGRVTRVHDFKDELHRRRCSLVAVFICESLRDAYQMCLLNVCRLISENKIHILETLAFSLWNEEPDEEERDNAECRELHNALV